MKKFYSGVLQTGCPRSNACRVSDYLSSNAKASYRSLLSTLVSRQKPLSYELCKLLGGEDTISRWMELKLTCSDSQIEVLSRKIKNLQLHVKAMTVFLSATYVEKLYMFALSVGNFT